MVPAMSGRGGGVPLAHRSAESRLPPERRPLVADLAAWCDQHRAGVAGYRIILPSTACVVSNARIIAEGLARACRAASDGGRPDVGPALSGIDAAPRTSLSP